MKTFVFLFLLLSQSSLAVAPNHTALEGAWLEVDSKWINAPKEVAPHEQWSQTAVIYFGKDHKFALIYCTVYQVPKKYMIISNGDPRGVYTGEWNIHDDTVALTYQLVEQTIVLGVGSYRVPFNTQTSKSLAAPRWDSVGSYSIEKWRWTRVRVAPCPEPSECQLILETEIGEAYGRNGFR